MAKLLCDLLGFEAHKFNATIARLESVTLNKGTDVNFTANIITSSREKVRGLGLDPEDSTKIELYHALLEKVRTDSKKLREVLKIPTDAKSSVMAKKIATSAQKLVKKDKVVAVSSSAIKKILIAVPPKKTLRALKFRSVDAVLKREDPLIVYSLAKIFEDKSWNTQVEARLKRLQPRDVSESNVKILSLPEAWIVKLKDREFATLLFTVNETGSILILPSMPTSVDGAALLTMLLVLQASQHLSVFSLPFRMQSFTHALEKRVLEMSSGSTQPIKPVYGLSPNWEVVYRLLSIRKPLNNDFELILGDINWQTIESKIASLVPEMDYWVNSHYLGYVSATTPVTFHVVDVAASLVLGREFGEQVVSHFRASLWNEIILRYMQHQNIEKAVLEQLTTTQGPML